MNLLNAEAALTGGLYVTAWVAVVIVWCFIIGRLFHNRKNIKKRGCDE